MGLFGNNQSNCNSGKASDGGPSANKGGEAAFIEKGGMDVIHVTQQAQAGRAMMVFLNPLHRPS